MSSQNPIPVHVSISDSTKSYDTRLLHRKNSKTLLVVSSSSRNENSQIRVRDEGLAQTRIVIEEVDSHLRSDIIELDDIDKDDRISLREMKSSTKIFIVVLLSNHIPISFVELRLKLRDEDLEDEEL